MGRRSTHAWIGTAAMLAATASVCAAPARAAADPRRLCIVRAPGIPGLEPGALGPALQLEQRKRQEPWESVDVATSSDCPASTDLFLSLESPAMAEVHPAAGSQPSAGSDVRIRMDLSAMDPLDRAAEVARIVVSGLGSIAGSTSMVEAQVTGPAPAPSTTAPPAGPAGLVRLGGLWAWESGPDRHGAGVDLEAGASLFDERLEIGVRAGWEPPRSATIDAGTRRTQAVPVVAVVRGGLRLGRVRLLAGFAAGVEWRRLELQPPTRFGRLARDSAAGLLEGSIEGAIAAWGPLRVALAAVFRGYVGGPSIAWNGRTAWEAPAWSAGLALRIGVVFRGRSPNPSGRGIR